MRQYNHHLYFSSRERVDLLKAWLATSLAFGVFFLTGMGLKNASITAFAFVVIIAAITAGAGFILHELAHKLTANRFGVHSEFRSHDQMLVISIIIAFLGVIFAAPGAVYMTADVTRKESGIISAAGPIANIIIASAFLAGVLLTPNESLLHAVSIYGLLINAMLGAFNMIPFGDFDGVKILRWSKAAYTTITVAAAILVVIAFILPSGA
ncbi:TPA: metalloprotease [Candidatus Woesearchaeota archaeon]|nr:metalloprotease [Candidatus Woesearchaeota archaeon]